MKIVKKFKIIGIRPPVDVTETFRKKELIFEDLEDKLKLSVNLIQTSNIDTIAMFRGYGLSDEIEVELKIYSRKAKGGDRWFTNVNVVEIIEE